MSEHYKKLGKRIAGVLSRRINSAQKLWTLVAKELFLALSAQTDVVTSFPYEAPNRDVFIYVETQDISGQVTIDLSPDPPESAIVIVKDSGGHANKQNIRVRGNGSSIDGTSARIINEDFGSLIFTYDGGTWRVIGAGGGTGVVSVGAPNIEEFDVSGSGDDTYSLTNNPASTSVRVLLNGLQLQTDEYTVSGSDVTVSHTIAAGDEVAIIYYV